MLALALDFGIDPFEKTKNPSKGRKYALFFFDKAEKTAFEYLFSFWDAKPTSPMLSSMYKFVKEGGFVESIGLPHNFSIAGQRLQSLTHPEFLRRNLDAAIGKCLQLTSSFRASSSK